MDTFTYYKPQSVNEAINFVEQEGGKVQFLAGGTDLLVRLKNRQIAPSAVIDLKEIDELNQGIQVKGRDIYISALTTFARINADPIIIEHFPALAEAAGEVGSVQIRNRATLGGNICNASPAADSLPPLFIYNVTVKLISKDSSRLLPIGEFLLGPGKTALEPDEILGGIVIPLPGDDQASSFARLTRRLGADLATINICCQVFRDGLTRFAVGAAAPIPFIVEDNSGLLSGSTAELSEKKRLISKLMQAASPITDIRASKEYRQAMLDVLALRTLEKALQALGD
jgi:CO/xanthine dehydrogenase FAD-binding subunit